MNYIVIVSDDEALYFTECRRKQGYVVTLKPINYK